MPDNRIKMVWDMVIIIIIILFFCIIPMQICFDVFYDDELEEVFKEFGINHYLGIFLVTIPDIFLIIDTFLKCLTGFYEDGIVVVDKSKIIAHYLRKGLFFDLLSYFPVILQGVMRKNFPELLMGHEYIIKYMQIMMFFKIKRVKTAISNFEEIISSKGGHDSLLSAFRLTYVLLFVTHLNACFWHATAYFNPIKDVSTWLDFSELREEYWLKKYLYSLYWAISTMATVGFEESVRPQNNLEMIVGAIILIVSMFLFGYCINSMKQILDMMAKQETEYKYFINIKN